MIELKMNALKSLLEKNEQANEENEDDSDVVFSKSSASSSKSSRSKKSKRKKKQHQKHGSTTSVDDIQILDDQQNPNSYQEDDIFEIDEQEYDKDINYKRKLTSWLERKMNKVNTNNNKKVRKEQHQPYNQKMYDNYDHEDMDLEQPPQPQASNFNIQNQYNNFFNSNNFAFNNTNSIAQMASFLISQSSNTNFHQNSPQFKNYQI